MMRSNMGMAKLRGLYGRLEGIRQLLLVETTVSKEVGDDYNSIVGDISTTVGEDLSSFLLQGNFWDTDNSGNFICSSRTIREKLLQFISHLEHVYKLPRGESQLHKQLLAILKTLNPTNPNIMPPGIAGIATGSIQISILPGSYFAAFAGLLNVYKPDSEIIVALYALVGCAIVLWQGLTRIRKVQIVSKAGRTSVANQRCSYLAELLFMSLFIMLNTSLLLAAYTGMDMYGLFAISQGVSKFTSILYSGLVNLGISVMATVIFYILWQFRFGREEYERSEVTVNTFITVLPPLLLAYVVVALFGTLGSDVYFMVVLIPFSLAFLIIAGYSHPRNKLDPFLAKVLLIACSVGILLAFLLAIIGLILIITVTESADIPQVAESHVWSRSIDWSSLGYEPDQYISKHEAGFIWMVLTGMAYMILIPGSALLMTVYRLQYLPATRGQ